MLTLSVFAVILGIIADSEAGKIISLTGFIACIIGTRTMQSYTKSPVFIANSEYHKARQLYKRFVREVNTLYANDNEAQKMLTTFSSSIKRLKRERYQSLIKVGIIVLLSACVIIGVITYF